MTAAFDPWLWAAIAVGLGILEMLLPGYVMLGFAAAAAAIAAGLAVLPTPAAPGPHGLLVLLVLWATLALAVWFALARRFSAKARARRSDDKDVNDFTPGL